MARVLCLVALVGSASAFTGFLRPTLSTTTLRAPAEPMTPRDRQTTVVGGIPKLFRWLTDQYPTVNQRISDGLSANSDEIDNLYLDMNGIIHMCTHANSDEIVIMDEKMMLQRIFTYTDRIYKIVRPKKIFYLAVDGVAPRAKMNQQRSRRFRSSKEQEQLMAQAVARGGEIPDEASRFDSNCITPGTDFMYKLNLAFGAWIEFKCANDPFWIDNGAEVVFSGPDVPGEGEHKVMDYIRNARATADWWSPSLRHIFYGLDADLIMLSLVTHENNFMLLREKMSVRHGKQAKSPINYGREDFELLEISLLRKLLSLQFVELQDPNKYPFELNLERCVDDFVFICMFVGNDFLPHVVHLDIADGSLNMMMNAYKDMLPSLGGYLTDKTKIHLPRLELFFAELAKYEPHYFERRAAEVAAGGSAAATAAAVDAAFDKETYAQAYYADKFGWSAAEMPTKRRALVEDYVAGLYWVLEYYHRGCGSWDWFFPHLYAPLASDVVDLAPIQVTVGEGRPFTPLMQLLSVLPAASGRHLPPAYSALMTDPSSPLAAFYPPDFEVDANGKRNDWEAVVKIPFLDQAKMLDALTTIDHKTALTPQERLRNLLGEERSFRPATVGAAAQGTAPPPKAKAPPKPKAPKAKAKAKEAATEA